MREPKWYTRHVDVEKLTDEMLEKMKEEALECDKENEAEYARLHVELKKVIETAKSLYGVNHNLVKQLTKAGQTNAPTRFILQWENFRSRLERHRKEKHQANEKVLDEQRKVEHFAKAVVWLTARGKILGTDYQAHEAVKIANGIAELEEIERLVEAHVSHRFSGCDTCDDWDGESNRCSCGNRRVAWTTGMSHSFESPHVYPEAH